MERYDYFTSICDDIRNYISENITLSDHTREDLEEALNEDLWTEDSVTGNASGSYTFNAWYAEEYISHNLDLLQEALREFGCSTADLLDRDAECCDVTIRCYLLGQCISEVLGEYEDTDFSEC